MKDIKAMLESRIKESIQKKVSFDILYISDESSRLAFTRGMCAMDEFRHFYGNIANISVVSMDSKQFCKLAPSLAEYNVVWVDNVINRDLNVTLAKKIGELLNEIYPEWEADSKESSDREQFIDDLNEYRGTFCRIIYALDEFIWDAPAGRQKSVISAITAEDGMAIADSVIVPNIEMSGAIKEIGLVPENKEVLVIPTFINESFYPVNKDFSKSSTYATSIRTPRILVKGTMIPKNVQDFIIHSTDSFNFAISSVGVLDERLMSLIANHKVENLVHWANPYVTSKNMLKTAALERDGNFDFVILTIPTEEIEGELVVTDAYNITNVDTDAKMAIASGAVAIAGVDDANYGKGVHICVESKMTFSNSTSVKDLKAMLTKWSICLNWDAAYKAQRKLLGTQLVSSPAVLAGYFNAMLGRKLSEAKKAYFDERETK